MEDFTFNLSLNEGYFEEDPRKCRCERRVTVIEHRTTAMLVSVSPPYSGERYCIDTPEIKFALVGPRFGGDSLFPINTWPMPVNISLPVIARPEMRESISYKERDAHGVKIPLP